MTTPTPREFRLYRLADELRELTTPIGKEAATILERQASTLLMLHDDLAAARAERDALKAHAEALRSELYRYTDSVDNAAIRAFDEAMGAAVFGGGQPEATSGNTTTHSGKSVQATHSQECPDHEQKPPQPAHKGKS